MKFFELLQITLGNREAFSEAPTIEEWHEIYDNATRQALIGVLFSGVERLPAEQRPPREMILPWFMMVSKIEKRNALMNEACVKVTEKFIRDGFDCCILKGQGVAAYYPAPLRRQSGDIDAWVLPKERNGKDIDQCARVVIDYAHQFTPDTKASYHHVDFPAMRDVAVEIHYRPSYMFCPRANCRLQKYFYGEAGKQFLNTIEMEGGKVSVPTAEFNAVFLLSHIYRHLYEEGIGLRQLLDYYYMLVSTGLAEDNEKREAVLMQLERCGMKRIARAVMYVLGESFGMQKKYMIIDPDERTGKFLLNEIMLTGNFGQYDERVSDATRNSAVGRNRQRLKRDVMLFRYFPEECISEPFFRMYHWWWRRRIHS
ncbi:MAG: nucleotidyltransferase family protein [Prevotella sp.]|nr:nucleotidyltransferase family protein [Prevotella sp.]MBR4600952.1 nucleotidyltransferase family protein [Prevotella sp.]